MMGRLKHRLRLGFGVVGLTAAVSLQAQVKLLANGSLTGSSAGSYADLSGLTGNLENGVPANALGGLGSGLAYISTDRFLAVPDRGPNAVSYNSAVDDTDSYINRFHTIKMNLQANTSGTGLPFTIAPLLEKSTLLSSGNPLAYGSGAGLGVGSGAPAANFYNQYFFTGRSDNFDPAQNSGNATDARLDPEGIRLSNDGLSVFISDEYGPYVYQFNRAKGTRIRSFALPSKYYVSNLSPVGATEISGNTAGRTANKGLEGLAISPDGKTLITMIQAPLIQDSNAGATKLLRFLTIDITSGTTHEYAYNLTTGSGVSEILALNNHELLVDERDGKGLGDTPTSQAKYKQVFKIDFANAVDVSNLDGPAATAQAVSKSLFLDIVNVLTASGLYTPGTIPSKIEGLAFGPDVQVNGTNTHTLWVANDNDFVQNYNGVANSNPNVFFVFGFTDADLRGSIFVPQTRTGNLN